MVNILILTILGILVAAEEVQKEKRATRCFGDLGCFGTGAPFFSLHRPINLLPSSPESIDTKFRLFTRKNSKTDHLLVYNDISTIHGSFYDASKPTKMIVHGFIDNGRTSWMIHMKDELLKHADYNVINVDWGGGSLPPYAQATANTRMVGAVIARLIKYLQKEIGAKPETFHIMGHSLGAHICGYAGERVRTLGRISGLDPAEPYFQYTDKTVRLDASDAQFVDILHTDGISILQLGYGMIQPCGHVDYYPNGGETQPGCDKGPVTSIATNGIYNGVKQFVACNHLRAYDLFTESINAKCPFEAYQCTNYDQFQSGNCIPCTGNRCGYMGFHADKVKPPKGQTNVKYYLKTASGGPFCRYHDQIQMSFKASARTERGSLFASVIGDKGKTERVQLTEDVEIEGGKSYTYLLLSKIDVGKATKIELDWKHNSKWYKVLDWNLLNFRHPTIYVDRISVVNGEESKLTAFCTSSTPIETGKKVTLSSKC